MADTKISGLSAAATFDGSELFEVVQSGSNKKGTLSGLYAIVATAAQGALAATALQPGAIGVSVQAYDAELAALAGLASAANKVPYFTGSGSAALLSLDTDGTLAANSDSVLATQKAVKTYADSLIAANDAMVFKGLVNCSANPNYPAADAGHTYRVSVAGKIGGASGVVVEAGDMIICLADGTAAGNQATVGANWGVIQMNLDGALTTTSIGSTVQAYDPILDAFSSMVTSADKGLYFTGADAPAQFDLTAFARTLLDDANQAAMQSTLGLVPGTDVQAYDAELAAIAGLISAADKVPYFTGAGAAALATQTAFARTLLDDADAPAARATLGALGSGPQSTTAVTVGNTTTKTDVATIAIPANSIAGTKAVSVRFGGVYQNSSGSGKNITFEIKLGSTVLWSSTSGSLASGGLRAFDCEIYLVALGGSTSSQFMHGRIGISGPGNAGTGQGDISSALVATSGFQTPICGPNASGASEDATTTLNLVLSVTHSAASASTQFQLNDYSVDFHP